MIRTAIIGLVVLAIIGVAGYVATSDNDQAQEQTAITQPDEDTSQTPSNETDMMNAEQMDQTEPAQTAGRYITYDQQDLSNSDGTNILFFHANWCPQCRALERDIIENGVPAGVTFYEVDYDTNQDLRQKYGVTIQTTLVKVDNQGNQLAKYNAYSSPTLQAVVDNLL